MREVNNQSVRPNKKIVKPLNKKDKYKQADRKKKHVV